MINVIEKKNSLFSEFSLKAKVFYIVLLFITFFTFFFDFFYFFSENNFLMNWLRRFLKYFTHQTVFTVLVILISFLFSFKNKKILYFFTFLVLVNSLLTFLVYHILLMPFWTENNIFYLFYKEYETLTKSLSTKNFKSILEHFIIPLGYFLFFLFVIPFSFKSWKKIFYTFVHPILFLSIFYIISFFPKLYKDCVIGHEKCFFPYGNIQCPIEGQKNKHKVFGDKIFGIFDGKKGVFLRIFILILIFTFVFAFIFYLKNKFNEKFFPKEKIFIYI